MCISQSFCQHLGKPFGDYFRQQIKIRSFLAKDGSLNYKKTRFLNTIKRNFDKTTVPRFPRFSRKVVFVKMWTTVQQTSTGKREMLYRGFYFK